MPLIGIDYKKENGEIFHIDFLSCCIFPANIGTSAWKESDLKYDPTAAKSFLSRLNYFGLEYLTAVRQNRFIPCGLVKNDVCASCSFLKDCFYSDIAQELRSAIKEETPGILSSFFDKFEEKLKALLEKYNLPELKYRNAGFIQRKSFYAFGRKREECSGKYETRLFRG